MKAAALDWEAGRPHEVGVALAAVQIDRPYRIIIVRNSFEDKNDKTFNVLINPEVVKLEGEVVEDFEGCLSVPDIYGKVGRSSRVRVRAIDENGQPIRLRAEGFLARVLQHEIDHISGRMFIDYIKDKPDAFFKLTPGGKLEGLPYETIQKSNIFRD
jgi:peptide deformylase